MSLVHAEYLKISRRWLWPVMLAVLGVLVALAAFTVIFLPQLADEVPTFAEKPEIYVYGAQNAIQTWFPVILAVVFLGGEFSTTAWATALTRDSRQGRQVGSRLLVLTVASWLSFIVATLGFALLAAIGAEGEGSLTVTEWLDIGWRLGLVALAWTSIGLAAVAIFRSVGPAIAIGLVLAIFEGLIALWPPYANVSLTNAGTSLFFVDLLDDGFGFALPGAISTTHAVIVMLAWTAAGFLLTYWGLQRRDA